MVSLNFVKMPGMDWFPLTMICALAIASADAFSKYYLSEVSAVRMMLARFSVPGILLLPLLYFYPLPTVPAEFWPHMVMLVALELTAMWFYVIAIRQSPLYLTLPYLAFTPVFSAILSFFVLGEQINTSGFLGILLVMLGTYIINFKKIRLVPEKLWLLPLTALAREQGSRLMLGVAAIYSITSVYGKKMMMHATPESFGIFYFVMVGGILFLITLLVRPREIRIPSKLLLPYLLIGILMSVMVVTHFLALARIEVAYMLTVKRTSLIFGLLLGMWLFREKNIARNLFAGMIIISGVAFIMNA